MADYTLSKEAVEDMRGIARYTVKTFGKQQAEIYRDGFRDCFLNISQNPRIGRVYDHIRLGLRRFEHQSHSVYYMLQDDGPLIVRVLHNRQEAIGNL